MTTSETIFDNDPLLTTEKKKFLPTIGQAWLFPVCNIITLIALNFAFGLFFRKQASISINRNLFLISASLLLLGVFLVISLSLKNKTEPNYKFSFMMPSWPVLVLLPFITCSYSIFFIGVHELLHTGLLNALAPGIQLVREKPLIYAIIAVLLEPFLAEAFYRGILLDSFLKKYSPVMAILNVAAIGFAFYLSPVLLVYLFAGSVLQSWMYQQTGNLSINIYTRFLFNLPPLLLPFLITDNFDYQLQWFLTNPVWVISSGLILTVAIFLLHHVFISSNKVIK